MRFSRNARWLWILPLSLALSSCCEPPLTNAYTIRVLPEAGGLSTEIRLSFSSQEGDSEVGGLDVEKVCVGVSHPSPLDFGPVCILRRDCNGPEPQLLVEMYCRYVVDGPITVSAAAPGFQSSEATLNPRKMEDCSAEHVAIRSVDTTLTLKAAAL